MAAKPLAIQRNSNVDLKQISGWASLESQEQHAVKDNTDRFFEYAETAGKNRLLAGQVLSKNRDILKPKRMWEKYLTTLKISRATANRIADDYEKTRTILPPPVMRVAMLRGTQSLKVATIKALPPPKTENFAAINEYLDKAEKHQRAKRAKEAESDPETLEQILVNQARLFLERLPDDPRTRRAFLRSTASKMFACAGMTGKIMVTPSEIPDGYFTPVGRPRLNKA